MDTVEHAEMVEKEDGRGASRSGYSTPVRGEDFYTVDEAARILKLTAGRIKRRARLEDTHARRT